MNGGRHKSKEESRVGTDLSAPIPLNRTKLTWLSSDHNGTPVLAWPSWEAACRHSGTYRTVILAGRPSCPGCDRLCLLPEGFAQGSLFSVSGGMYGG